MSQQEWSKQWKNSTKPGKQRKYRANAPYHHRNKFVSATLADDVEETVGTSSIPVREGDRVRIMRGDFSGRSGEIRDIDREEYKIYIDGLNRDTVSGSETPVAIDPSNVKVIRLNLDDDMRMAKYGLTDAEADEISAEQDVEEPDEDEEAEADEDESYETAADVDYDALVEENIGDVKDRVRDDDLDEAKVLEAEQANKDRKTLVEWLENRMED